MKRTAIVLAAITLAVAGTMAYASATSAAGPGGKLGLGPGKAVFDSKLAEALGITQDELQAARAEAFAAVLDDAVAAGRLTQEQADNRLARFRLKGAVDPKALLAEALGLSVDELKAAREDGKTIRDLAKELDIDAATLRSNLKAAWSSALDQAVEDGIITQEQADKLSDGGFLRRHRGRWGHGRHPGWGGHGGRHGPGRGSPSEPLPDVAPIDFGV